MEQPAGVALSSVREESVLPIKAEIADAVQQLRLKSTSKNSSSSR